MSNRQASNRSLRNAVFTVLAVFLINLIYISEPAGPVSQLFHSAMVFSTQTCFSVADYVQEFGDGIFEEWQLDPQHKDSLPEKPPHHVVYALKSSEFGADMLRYIGSSLASQAISYRNYGSSNPLTLWPARIVLTARGLFLPEEALNLSFTPIWATNL